MHQEVFQQVVVPDESWIAHQAAIRLDLFLALLPLLIPLLVTQRQVSMVGKVEASATVEQLLEVLDLGSDARVGI